MIPGLSLVKVGLISLLMVGGGIGLVSWFSSDLPEPTPLEELTDIVHDRVCDGIVEELPTPSIEDGRLLIPPVVGDHHDALRTRLARAIARSGRYEVLLADAPQPESWFEEEVLPAIGPWLSKIPGISVDDDRPPWLLEGRITDRQDDDQGLALSVAWKLRNLTSDGQLVAAGTAEESIESSLLNRDYLRWRIGETSPVLRILAWIIAIVVPWVLLRPLTLEILRKESNGWNAVLWGFAATPGLIVGYWMTAFAAGWGGAVLAIISAAGTLVFSYGWLNWLETTRR